MTAPRKRTTRQPTTLPEARGNKRYVSLVRGKVYHLITPNIRFEHGAPQEVSEEVYDYLAARATDTMSYVDPAVGRVRRSLRKFAFSPPLDEVAGEVIVGW